TAATVLLLLRRAFLGVLPCRRGFRLGRLGFRDLHVVERPEIAVIDLGGDLVAYLELLQYVFLIRGIRHRHLIHPTFNLLAIHNESLIRQIDLLDFTFEDVLLLWPRGSIL